MRAPTGSPGARHSTMRLTRVVASTNAAWEAHVRVLAWKRWHMSPLAHCHGGGTLKRRCAHITRNKGCGCTLSMKHMTGCGPGSLSQGPGFGLVEGFPRIESRVCRRCRSAGPRMSQRD